MPRRSTMLQDADALARRIRFECCSSLTPPHNRRMLALYRGDLRASFPLDMRPVMATLRAGRTPEANGIVVL